MVHTHREGALVGKTQIEKDDTLLTQTPHKRTIDKRASEEIYPRTTQSRHSQRPCRGPSGRDLASAVLEFRLVVGWTRRATLGERGTAFASWNQTIWKYYVETFGQDLGIATITGFSCIENRGNFQRFFNLKNFACSWRCTALSCCARSLAPGTLLTVAVVRIFLARGQAGLRIPILQQNTQMCKPIKNQNCLRPMMSSCYLREGRMDVQEKKGCMFEGLGWSGLKVWRAFTNIKPHNTKTRRNTETPLKIGARKIGGEKDFDEIGMQFWGRHDDFFRAVSGWLRTECESFKEMENIHQNTTVFLIRMPKGQTCTSTV